MRIWLACLLISCFVLAGCTGTKGGDKTSSSTSSTPAATSSSSSSSHASTSSSSSSSSSASTTTSSSSQTTTVSGNGTGNTTGNQTTNTTSSAGPETYYLHAPDVDTGAMDHTPADGAEPGDGTTSIAQPASGYEMDYAATEAVLADHDAASKVNVYLCVQTDTPAMVSTTADLQVGGTSIGKGSASTLTTTVVQVPSMCAPITITFTLTARLDAGAKPTLVVKDDYPGHTFPHHPGGKDGPRMILSAT